MLGERFLASGAISAAQLQTALEEQRGNEDLLGQILLRLSFVSETGLAKVLAQEAGVPFMSINGTHPDPSAVALVPETFARRRQIAPLRLQEGVLEVLQANPFDVITIDELQRLTRHPAQVVCGTRSDVLRLIDRSYSARTDSTEPKKESLTPTGRSVRTIEALGFGRRNLTLLHHALNEAHGIVLVTGPAGAGKTTTLYAALTYLAGLRKNIVTVEDPIEHQLPAIRQTDLRKAGFTFGTAIRSLLRQHPDVMMVSEIGDPDTAQQALRAALSGVFVLSTLPAADSIGALARFMDMGLEPQLVAAGVAAALAQRLVRAICPHCKAPAAYNAELLAKVGLAPDPGLVLYRGLGCDRCGGTGYLGRMIVAEILVMNGAIHSLVRDRAESRLIKAAAIRGGMKPLMEDALAKAIFGQTTIEEVVRVAYV